MAIDQTVGRHMSSKRLIQRSNAAFPVRSLTVVFGALPATMFSWFAVLAIMAGLSQIAGGGIVFVTIGMAGLYGTVSLWAVAFGKDSKAVVIGLISGSLAMVFPLLVPSSIVPDMLGIDGRALTTFLEASPVVVALIWLVYFFLRSGAREIASRDAASSRK